MDVATLQVMDEVASGAIHFSSLQKLTMTLEEEEEDSSSDSEDVATPSFLSLPWNQLTKFTGTVYTNEDCLEVLRLAPNLTECAFAAFQGTDDIDADTLIVHSRLTSLTLFDATEKSDTGRPVCSTEILQFLTLPALQSLYILHCETEGFSDDVFHNFLSRSSPPLRKFAIRQDPVTNLDAASFLLMPGLLDLEMSYITTELATEFFESFGSDTSFLPQLEHLSILGCGLRRPEPYLYLLLETVESGLTDRWSSRGEGFAKLKSFSLVCNQDFGELVEDVLDPFKDLAADGLDVHIEGTREVYV
ncbi:hypothetical protein DFH06DRAFT_1366554 [Mycena polygramma]|nr:hypothetical protein DFH06DRAFT_1366554 [Mycena polygramma]